MMDMTCAGTLILASASPRRKELLSVAGIPFEVMVSEAKEETDRERPEEIVKDLSRLKAQAVMDSLPSDKTEVMVLGADTIVWQDGKALGKPRDAGEARAMIESLQGNVHSVFTGVTLLQRSGAGSEPDIRTVSFHCETKVRVRPMDGWEIEAYVASGEPFDKAGGYGIQGPFSVFVEGIEGDYANVVGLPVAQVYRSLKELGWIVPGGADNSAVDY